MNHTQREKDRAEKKVEIAMACQFCRLCADGFPIKDGFHYGTQALGMIPSRRCTAVPKKPDKST